MIYKCSITVYVDAESPEEAVRKAQEIIDDNTDYWIFSVDWTDPAERRRINHLTIDAAKVDL